ncbi:MAG: hypothetical protein U0165_15015 [Polyangiaceae bacterium]
MSDGPFVAQQIATNGSLTSVQFEVVPANVSYQPPAIAALGTGLGVGWIDETGQVPHAFVRAFDKTGQGTVPLGFDTGFGTIATALGSPDGMHLLLGWSEYGQAANPQRVKVQRFDCTGPAQ